MNFMAPLRNLKNAPILSQNRCLSALCIATALVASGCTSSASNRSGFFSAYKVDIPQGNYLTKEMLAQVKEGMSAQQVKFALGAPLLMPVFSADRWDYVFRYQHANGTSDLRRVVIRFKDTKVNSIESDELPAREDGTDKALPQGKSRVKAGA